LTGGADRTARLWDVATGAPVCPPLEHDRAVIAVAISWDGKTLLTGTPPEGPDGNDKGRAHLWEAATGKPLPGGPGYKLHAAALSRDGRLYAAGSFAEARVWETAGGRLRGRSLTHSRWVRDLAFSADGRYLFTASEDRLARRWDVERGALVGDPMPHPDWVTAMVLSPDGRLLATATVEGVRLWDATTHKRLGPVLPLPYPGTAIGGWWGGGLALAFVEEGRALLVCGQSQEVLRWDLPGPVAGSVERVGAWTEWLTAAALDRDGVNHALEAAERARRLQRLREMGGTVPDEP
jgi:WD40 repeat protein